MLFARLRANLLLPAAQIVFIHTLFAQDSLHADNAAHALRIEFSQLAALDANRLRIVAAHEEDLACAVLAGMGAYPLDPHLFSGQRIGPGQQVVDLQRLADRGLCGSGGRFRLRRTIAAPDTCQKQQGSGRRHHQFVRFHHFANFSHLYGQR